MKKAKGKSTGKRGRKKQGKKKKSGGPGSRKAVNLPALRQRITNKVGGEAMNLVDATIIEGKKGQHTSTKYLFEMIGLYPAAAQEEAPVDDSLAKTLLRRLNLPEEAHGETKVIGEQLGPQAGSTADTVE